MFLPYFEPEYFVLYCVFPDMFRTSFFKAFSFVSDLGRAYVHRLERIIEIGVAAQGN